MMRLKHANIVRFFGYCADTQWKMFKHDGRHVIAEARQRLLCFEFVPNGSLDKYISGMTVERNVFHLHFFAEYYLFQVSHRYDTVTLQFFKCVEICLTDRIKLHNAYLNLHHTTPGKICCDTNIAKETYVSCWTFMWFKTETGK